MIYEFQDVVSAEDAEQYPFFMMFRTKQAYYRFHAAYKLAIQDNNPDVYVNLLVKTYPRSSLMNTKASYKRNKASYYVGFCNYQYKIDNSNSRFVYDLYYDKLGNDISNHLKKYDGKLVRYNKAWLFLFNGFDDNGDFILKGES